MLKPGEQEPDADPVTVEPRRDKGRVVAWLPVALFAAVTASSLDYRMLVEVVGGRAELQRSLYKRAERTPGLTRFLSSVREQTRNGETVALILDARDAKTYGYALIRANYILAGRTVVPMIGSDGAYEPSVRRARYLALFHMQYAGRGTVVLKTADGLLVRQR